MGKGTSIECWGCGSPMWISTHTKTDRVMIYCTDCKITTAVHSNVVGCIGELLRRKAKARAEATHLLIKLAKESRE